MVIQQGIQKPFFFQSGQFSLAANITLTDYTQFDWGLSGSLTHESANFKMLNGKIYDPYGRFIYSYRANNEIEFSGNFGPGYYDLYVNDEPVAIGQPMPLSGCDSVYFNPHNTQSCEVDYYLFGRLPNYYMSTDFVFHTGDAVVTGYIINYSPYDLVIYSGDFGQNTSMFNGVIDTGVIHQNGTGYFYVYPSGGLTVGNTILLTDFFTNFGSFTYPLTFSGIESSSSDYYINLSGPTTIYNGYKYSYYGQFGTYDGSIMNVVPLLQYVAGSGNQNVFIDISAPYSVNASGYIVQSGYIYANIEVTGSGQGGASNNTLIEVFSGQAQGFQWATGNFIATVSCSATGYGTGIGYSGLAVSTLTTTISGTIFDGSGSCYLYETITGNATSGYALNPRYNTPATGAIYYNLPEDYYEDYYSTNDILYINNIYQGIVYGFHYNSISTLVTYINENTGTFEVNASQSGGNTIFLTALELGTLGNSIILQVDRNNNGTMAVSGPTLLGGMSSGYNYPVVPIGGFTGQVDSLYINSGFYSGIINGTVSGSGQVVNENKDFSNIFDLFTGLGMSITYDYLANDDYTLKSGFYNPSSPMSATNSYIFINVIYNSPYQAGGDIARLVLSGIGNAEGIFADLFITGQL